MRWRFRRSLAHGSHRGGGPLWGFHVSSWSLRWGLLGPREVCVLEGGDFATSRGCQRHRGPRSLDQELLLCACLFQKRTLLLEADPCGISAKGKEFFS